MMANIDLNKLSAEEKMALVCMFYARLKGDDLRYKGHCYKDMQILAARYAVKYNTVKQNKDRYDAVFDNDRSGYHQKSLKSAHKLLYNIYLQYKDIPIEEHEAIKDQIMEEASSEGEVFLSIKTKDEKTVNKILGKSANVEFGGINILKDSIRTGQFVFIVFGGDRPSWNPGLAGMGIITRAPYDEGYDSTQPRNFKVSVDIKLLLDRAIKREDLVPYKDTYGIIGIGPITKWEPNQAISQVAEKNAVALMRAMLEISPSIEHDLQTIIPRELISRVKGAAVIMVPQEVDFGEPVRSFMEENETEEETRSFADKYILDAEEALDGFALTKRPLEAFRDFINSDKHIILTGPPGTGKTTLAERACIQAVKNNYVSGYIITTAISDWSTFDTIGGYMPDAAGQLKFSEGIFLKSIKDNKWIIVDEINRAEVDKAFGHFFTALAGKDVELPYKADITDTASPNLSIRQSDSPRSYYDSRTGAYYIGRNWRIIGTMNTYDKNSLFALSYAFMRRFALVPIPVPSMDEMEHIIRSGLSENPECADKLIRIVKASPRKLGAAIILDVIRYLIASEYRNIADGLCAVLIPQYEGISLPQIKAVYRDFGAVLPDGDKSILRDYLCEFFDVGEEEFARIQFGDEKDSDEE